MILTTRLGIEFLQRFLPVGNVSFLIFTIGSVIVDLN